MEKFEIQSQNLECLSPIFGAIRPNSRKSLEGKGNIWGTWGKFLDNCHPYFRRKNLGLSQNCRGKIWGQAPLTSNCGSTPLGCNMSTTLISLEYSQSKNDVNQSSSVNNSDIRTGRKTVQQLGKPFYFTQTTLKDK